MPTINPRVTVTLKPEQFEVLSRLSAARGVSMSSIISELWDVSAPVMARIAHLLEEAKGAQQSAKEGIREATEAALEIVAPQAAQVMVNFDLFEEQVLQKIADGRGAGGDTRRAATGGAAGAKPPSSNTGVRFSEPNRNKHLRKAKKP